MILARLEASQTKRDLLQGATRKRRQFFKILYDELTTLAGPPAVGAQTTSEAVAARISWGRLI
jgi:hypothetical protein